MNQTLTRFSFAVLGLAMLVGISSAAETDGKADKSTGFDQTSTQDFTTGEDTQAMGLLLPAVQSAREAARRTSTN